VLARLVHLSKVKEVPRTNKQEDRGPEFEAPNAIGLEIQRGSQEGPLSE